MRIKVFHSKLTTLLVLVVFIATLASIRASAAPQPLPFAFPVPELGDLEWIRIRATGTDTPLSGSCFDGTGLNIDDAINPDGDGDVYDGSWLSALGGQAIGTSGVGDLTDSTYTTVPVNLSGLETTYQLYFSDQVQCNRLVVTFDNNTGAGIDETFQIATNWGGISAETLATSSGDTVFSTADRWSVDAELNLFRSVTTTVFFGPGAPETTPTFATNDVCDSGNGIGIDMPINVPAGESRCLMFFACLGNITNEGNSIEGAIEAAQLFNNNDTIPADLLSGLSQRQLEECVNWNFAPRAVPTLSEWGMIAMAALIGIIGFIVVRRKQVGT